MRGAGLQGLRAPAEPIDCGNAGTLARLLPGILAGQQGQRFELTGDESLRSRPMGRIADPLTQMGAGIETADGKLPLGIDGRPLHAVRYELPVASAQVKSCVLLAGLYAADGPDGRRRAACRRAITPSACCEPPGPASRQPPGAVEVWPAERLDALNMDVPGDFSSAAPFLVAATLLPGSRLRLARVGVNPTRIGLLHVLERMGARISLFNRGSAGGEPVADIEVEHADLVATEVEPGEVPTPDRRAAVVRPGGGGGAWSEPRARRARAAREGDRPDRDGDERPAGPRRADLRERRRLQGAGVSRPARRVEIVESRGDHRIAILGAVAGLCSREGVRIEGSEAVSISFPGFFELLAQVAQR